MSVQTIELDCAPMTPRPDTHLITVLKDTGIEPVEARSKTFGNWEFDFSHIPTEKWEAVKPIIKDRIIALYNCGAIRYGSW